jgi:CheY-like chemotaxis protein
LIDHAAERGAELTRHLLAFGRKQPLQPRRTDLNALVLEAKKLFPVLGEHIEVEAILDETMSPAMVDPNQLSSALLNLAVNARDAMAEGGKITIETKSVDLDEDYAKANFEVQPGPYVMVAVSDTGSGIPAHILDKVMDPFFTTKGIGKGTGLGLSMVYGFVKQSNGHVKIYSEEGHGTTVRIYLPRLDAPMGAPGEPASAATSVGGTETVLLVEDDALVRSSATAQLQGLGYTVLTAANAAEALAIETSGVAFDLLFTDVMMPGGMNGRQLAEEFGRRKPALRVLYTSGYTENAIVHHGRLDPGVLLLSKPYRRADLARMVRAALAREAEEVLIP